MATLDSELLRHALSVARQHGFAEVELEIGEESFSALLDPVPAKKSAGKALVSPAAPESEIQSITSTFLGYYRPAKQPLLVGASVKKGDVVAIVAALEISNDVVSKISGEIVEVLVKPDEAVEYGQALAKVKI